MATFLEFYTTLLGFINFKLYSDMGLIYPPKVGSVQYNRVHEYTCICFFLSSQLTFAATSSLSTLCSEDEFSDEVRCSSWKDKWETTACPSFPVSCFTWSTHHEKARYESGRSNGSGSGSRCIGASTIPHHSRIHVPCLSLVRNQRRQRRESS